MVELDKRKHNQHDVRYDTSRRYDVLVTSGSSGFRLSEQAAHALIRNLKTKYWIRPYDEAIEEDWTEVYCHAEPTSSEIFTPGRFGSSEPVFLEAAIYFGREPETLDYNGDKKRVFFYIEFRGCLFKEPLAAFKKVFKDILHVRPDFSVRKHEALPPHREVEVYDEDEDD